MKRFALPFFALLGTIFFAAELPETLALARADGVATAVVVEHEREMGRLRILYRFAIEGREFERREAYFFPETLFLPSFEGSTLEIRYVRAEPALSAPSGAAGIELTLLLIGLAGCLVAVIRQCRRFAR